MTDQEQSVNADFNADTFFDAAAATEAQESTEEVEAAPADDIEATPETETETPEASDGDADFHKAENKKLKNAISRRDKKVFKGNKKLNDANERIRQLEARQAPMPPKEEDFEGQPYGDLLKAEARHAVAEERNTSEAEAARNESKAAQAELQAEYADHVNDSYDRAKEAIPDYDEVLSTSYDKEGRLPLSPSALDALHQSDDPAMALYILSKEQLFNDLNSSPTPIAAAFLVKDCLEKAKLLSKPKTVSTAPAPIASARGTAVGSKSIHEKSNEDILAFMKN